MKIFSVFILTIILLFPVRILSQDKEGEEADSLEYGLDEVTVVGTRTKEKIIDIPYSVFSVEKKELSYGKKVSARIDSSSGRTVPLRE